jgi:hypothetical protein
MEKLETYYIGLDELEASQMDRIANMNRAIDTMIKERDDMVRAFKEMFCHD